MNTTDSDQAAPPQKSRRWVYYFLVLAGLTGLAVATMIIYNLSQQLTEEQLNRAIKKWEAKGPEDYDLSYVTFRGADKKSDRFEVRVREGTVVSATVNDVPLKYKQLKYRSMDALLGDIKRFMEIDSEPGAAWTYTRGLFDPRNGRLKSYVRYNRWSGERIEIQVKKFEPTGEG